MTVIKKPWLDSAGPYKINHVPCPAYAGRADLSAPPTGVLHTTEGGFYGSEAVFEKHFAPHFLAGLDAQGNPRIDQLLPIGECGMACVGNNQLALVQIECVGFSKETPWLPDAKTLDVLAHLMVALEAEYGIPLTHPWPDGDYGRAGDNPHRHAGKFGKVAGWFGHGDMPRPPDRESHWDPGNLQWSKLFEYCQKLKGGSSPVAPVQPTSAGAVVGGVFYAAPQVDVATQIYNYLNGKASIYGALLPRHAVAFVAMADAETSFIVNISGDFGEAHGPFQFHSDRIKRAADGLKLPVATTYTLSTWLDLAWYDINCPQEANAFHALELLMQAKTAYDAAGVLTSKWERCGAPGQLVKRGKDATAWLVHFNPPTT